jgi:predicted amidohydrolase YtcJ
MSAARPHLVVCGQVLVAADLTGAVRAEAVGIVEDRVTLVGTRAEVMAAAAPGARVIDAGDAAVIPGLHDFHIHLVGLARTRSGVLLDGAANGDELLPLLRSAAARREPDEWVTGRGWSDAALASIAPGALEAAVGERPAFLSSHDGHSAWASATARRLAGLSAATLDPSGGRIERLPDGEPSGILRETALDLVAGLVPRAQGEALRPALEATLAELRSYGLTGASEAGDYTDRNGIGADADLGDSYSTLTDLADVVDGRFRMTLGIPVDAIPAAATRRRRTGAPLAGRRTMRFGWAKEYADGALGSGTAALFQPRSCGDHDPGILRVDAADLDALFAAARPAGIGLAIHAIGDRAAATVLDAVGRAPARLPGVPRDRMEHLQLLRASDRHRLAELGVIASIQPIHAAVDRDLVEACWDGRQDDAYAWRGLADAGALLAAGSDAPIESVNPWLGMFAARHRRLPTDVRDDWRPAEALGILEALHAYTLGPALALDASDEGHLRPGARADLAVLNAELDRILDGEVDFGAIRADAVLIDGSLAE